MVEEDLDRVTETIKNNYPAQHNHTIQFSIINAQGIRKRLCIETHFDSSTADNFTNYHCLMIDNTEKYGYEKALEEKVEQLKKSNLHLQEFVYVASHDLQEPVRKITTFTERLASRFADALGEEGSMYLKRIQNSSRNMQTLLDDLLNFSRLSFNDQPFEKVDLQNCMAEVINNLEVKIEESNASISFGELPILEAYPSQLNQLFNNLISNAIKFKKQNQKPVIQINFSRINPYQYPEYPLLKSTHYAKIEICDNGIGFEQEYSEKIFMIFQRLNSKAEYSGSGIGLSICKKIVDIHHGIIFATSQPNLGSTFTILLPYKIS